MYKVTSIACAVLLTAVAGACGKDDPITAFDRTTDCAKICEDYQTCFSTAEYDVDDCADSCSDMVGEEETDRIDACEECVDEGESCGEKLGCTSECAGLIPVTTG